MYYLIEKNVFQRQNQDDLINNLERLGLPYEITDFLPFSDIFPYDTDRTDIFPFCSPKMSRLSQKLDWYPGSRLCKNHDYAVYSRYYKENLLNDDSEIVRFGDEISVQHPFFARPTENTKAFTGRVFTMEEWRAFREEKLADGGRDILNETTCIQISSVKELQNEIRFWIVQGEIITASVYNLGGAYFLGGMIDAAATVFVKEMVKRFEINDTFTMDVCLTDKGYKIIECGCTNSAGFYKADINRLLIALENAYA
ncbi:ATP-grasp domain-containing protein [Eubacteriales bacterium OttesenSCG-928-M02]|nr:ATP-grasp domain-containing protein [Eubacteriales bacterium OttesenSCG-928-M02]